MRKLNVILSMIVLTQFSIAKAEEKTYEHKINSMREFSFEGPALEQEKANGHSGKGYGFYIDGYYNVICAEDLEKILKFRGYKTVKEFASAPIKNSSKEASGTLQQEYLLAVNKGRYTPPTDDKFVEKLANQIAESTDGCPDTYGIVDNENSYKMSSRLADSQENTDKLMDRLGSELRKNGSGMSLIKMKCDSDIQVRGQGWCYRLSKGGQQVSKFLLGPYDRFGFTCKSKKAQASKPEPSSQTTGSEAK